MSKPLREIVPVREGFARNIKRKIGHNMPKPLRAGVAAIAASGTAIRHDQEGDHARAARLRDFRSKVLKGRNVPKFGDS